MRSRACAYWRNSIIVEFQKRENLFSTVIFKKMKFNQFFSAVDSCPYCADKNAVVLSVVDGKTREKLITVACDGCGLGRVDPMPSEQDLDKWYKEK